MLIGPDPIIGRRGLEDTQPMPKMSPRTGARKYNALAAISLDISNGIAPRRTKKERNQ